MTVFFSLPSPSVQTARHNFHGNGTDFPTIREFITNNWYQYNIMSYQAVQAPDPYRSGHPFKL